MERRVFFVFKIVVRKNNFIMKIKRTIITFLAMFCVLFNVNSQNWNVKDLEDSVDLFIKPYIDSKSFMGSILIAKGDSMILVKGYGYSNLEHLIPNSSNTVFRIGSMTKQFTATAIMLLVQDNKISLDSKLSEFIPDYLNGDKITIHQLLTHTSGIPNYTKLPDHNSTMRLPATLPDLIGKIKNLPLDFEPGSKFRYSDSGYLILTYIIEKASGLTYSEFLDKYIFQPLGMKNTGYDNNQKIIKNRASGYSLLKKSNELVNADYNDMSVPQGAGGLYSTVLDLYKWDRSFYTDLLLSGESKEKMFTFYIADYGYGWGREIRKNGRISIGHNGTINGFSSIIHRFVADNTVIVILSNIDSFESNIIFDKIPAIYFKEDS